VKKITNIVKKPNGYLFLILNLVRISRIYNSIQVYRKNTKMNQTPPNKKLPSLKSRYIKKQTNDRHNRQKQNKQNFNGSRRV